MQHAVANIFLAQKMNIDQIAMQLAQNEVVAYPTESVFGLGCNPLSESAVEKLLLLKQRSREKGLIVIAPSLVFLLPFIDQEQLGEKALATLTASYDHPMTWVVPAHVNTPDYLKGKFNSLAVRICPHSAVQALCESTGFALTSTSANLSGFAPCKTVEEVRQQFGVHFPVLEASVGNAVNPSEIRDIFTNQIFRQG